MVTRLLKTLLDFILGDSRYPYRSGGEYLIEIRHHGEVKQYVKDLCRTISRKFKVKRTAETGRPPHITLYGNFSTKDEREMIARFVSVCKKYEVVRFTLRGFSHIENRVIYLDINPSNELRYFRSDLARELNPICSARAWDVPDKDFIFHTTVALNFGNKFSPIWSYVKNLKTPKSRYHVLRVTLLKNGRILSEYDLMQHRLLNRRQALSRYVSGITFKLLKQKIA